MKENLENLKHGFCLERTKLVLWQVVFQNLFSIKRNGRFLEDDFLRFVVAAIFEILLVAIPISTCSFWMLMEISFRYDFADQFLFYNLNF